MIFLPFAPNLRIPFLAGVSVVSSHLLSGLVLPMARHGIDPTTPVVLSIAAAALAVLLAEIPASGRAFFSRMPALSMILAMHLATVCVFGAARYDRAMALLHSATQG